MGGVNGAGASVLIIYNSLRNGSNYSPTDCINSAQTLPEACGIGVANGTRYRSGGTGMLAREP